MRTLLLLTLTGLGLGALYFLVACGLSLIYGLMDVLNFAHGAFLTVGAYSAWWAGRLFASGVAPGTGTFLLAVLVAVVVGGVVAILVERALVRPLYGRPLGQILVTVGLALALTALVRVLFTPDARAFPTPEWMRGTTTILGAVVPNSRFVAIGAAVLVYLALVAFLHRTRYGLIVRAGVENRAMVSALGIDVDRAFVLVFAIGGSAAALGGALTGAYFGTISPEQGASFLIFAFIVTIVGGLGSLRGVAVAAVLVGLLQQYANFYATVGAGDLVVVLLLAVLLVMRPGGLAGKAAL